MRELLTYHLPTYSWNGKHPDDLLIIVKSLIFSKYTLSFLLFFLKGKPL